MIPQKQRWHRGPVLNALGEQTDLGGDCFAACLASILELPIEGFPNFLAPERTSWWDRWQAWLYETYRLQLLYWEEDWPDPATQFAWWIGEVVPREVPHSVVFYKDEFRWDPAPDEVKREWSLSDVKSVVAPFCVASVFERSDGPPVYVPE